MEDLDMLVINMPTGTQSPQGPSLLASALHNSNKARQPPRRATAILNVASVAARTPHLRHIPLPSILPHGTLALDLHPTLRRGAVPLSMAWNARTPAYPNTASWPPWFDHPATYPAQTSIDIRASEVTWGITEERPIVVFPSDYSTSGIVTAKDVLDAVHCFVAAHHSEGCPRLWVGLAPSTTEHDVWVLQLA